MPEALLEEWSERGVDIVQGYGLTEAAPNVLCLPPEDARRKAGWAGKPYPYVTCDLAPDGELLVRGPNVFPGYWRNDEATADAFRDGWLLTGDIAERDDEGNYRIRGRAKEMVVSGGEIRFVDALDPATEWFARKALVRGTRRGPRRCRAAEVEPRRLRR